MAKLRVIATFETTEEYDQGALRRKLQRINSRVPTKNDDLGMHIARQLSGMGFIRKNSIDVLVDAVLEEYRPKLEEVPAEPEKKKAG